MKEQMNALSKLSDMFKTLKEDKPKLFQELIEFAKNKI